MSKLLLLFLTFVVGLIFLLPNDGPVINFYPFSDMAITLTQHVYFIGEKLVLIILAGIIANEATEYRRATWIFFLLVVVDLVDFLCCYNSVWFYLGGFPVSMNIVKCIVFGLTILSEWIRTLLSK